MNVLRKKKRLKVSILLALLVLALILVFLPLILITRRCIVNTTTTDVFQEMELQESRQVDLPYNRSECSLVNETAECEGINLNTIPENLPIRITELDLSYNSLENIDWIPLSKYKKTSILIMRWCSVNTVPEDAFQKLQQLRHVDLSYNRLSHLNNQIFKYNTKLTEVLLSGNDLRWDPASPLLISFSISRLELRDCGIQQISNATFSEIKMLEYLDVSRNKVIVLDSGTFHYDVFRELLIDPVEEISTDLSTVCRNGTRIHYIFDDVRENWCEIKKWPGIETTCVNMYEIGISALVPVTIVIFVVVYVLYVGTRANRQRKGDGQGSFHIELKPLRK